MGTMDKRIFDTDKGDWPSWGALTRIALTAFALFLTMRYWGALETALGMFLVALTAVFSGFCIAYVINIPLRFFEERLPRKADGKPNRGLALAISIAIIVVVLLAVLLLVVPQFLECMATFSQSIPQVVESLRQGNPLPFVPRELYDMLADVDWDDLSTKAFTWFQAGVASALPTVFSAAGILGTLGIGAIFSIWMLLDKEHLAEVGHRMVRTYLGTSADERLCRISGILDESFRNYIVGRTLEAAILGALISGGALLLGLPYATMVGPLVALMSFIPLVGAPLGAAIGAIMILSVSWQQALIYLVMFFVLQQFEANVIYVRVVGKMVGLDGFWTLLGITVSGALFGFAGALVGVPLTATLFRLISEDLETREASGDSLDARVHRALAE